MTQRNATTTDKPSVGDVLFGFKILEIRHVDRSELGMLIRCEGCGHEKRARFRPGNKLAHCRYCAAIGRRRGKSRIISWKTITPLIRDAVCTVKYDCCGFEETIDYSNYMDRELESKFCPRCNGKREAQEELLPVFSTTTNPLEPVLSWGVLSAELHGGAI